MRFVASLAKRLQVGPVIPSVRCLCTRHDVVHLLAEQATPRARRILHEPQPPDALPLAAAVAGDVVSLKALRAGYRRSRVERFGHGGIPRPHGVGHPGDTESARACGLTA